MYSSSRFLNPSLHDGWMLARAAVNYRPHVSNVLHLSFRSSLRSSSSFIVNPVPTYPPIIAQQHQGASGGGEQKRELGDGLFSKATTTNHNRQTECQHRKAAKQLTDTTCQQQRIANSQPVTENPTPHQHSRAPPQHQELTLSSHTHVRVTLSIL